MKHLHLLVPDLFPPQDIAAEVCAGLQLPALEKMLARATATAAAPILLEDWLCNAFGASGVAPVRAAADGLATAEGYWFCADPVSLHLQRAQVVLVPDSGLQQDEAAAMCASLNEHFAGSGMRFFAPHPQRWYLAQQDAPRISTTPLRTVAWQDAKLHLPQGEGALEWQRILTEVQMLLYAHPLNRAREARGQPVVNSLWLWGEGRAVLLKQAFDAAGGDCGLVAAFANAAGVKVCDSLPALLAEPGQRGLWMCAAPGDALLRGDVFAWREAVQQFEQECARPLLQALQTGSLRQLVLEVPGERGSRSYTLGRGAAWALWRSARPLAGYAV